MFKNPKVKKIFNISTSILLSILIILIIIFTIYAFNSKKNGGIPKFFGKSYLTILSDSMAIENEEYDFEGFERGDIIVINRYQWYEASQIKFNVGDIITFEGTDDDGNFIYITHRIIAVNEDHYITQGDVAASLGYSTNPKDKHAEKVYFNQVVGSYVKTIPNVGHIFILFQSSVGFLIFIVLPLVGLFVVEIFNFRKAYIAYRNEKHPKASPEELQKEIERLKAQLEKTQTQENK
jgi:signal peptidase I